MRAEGCGASALPVPIVSGGGAAAVRLGTRLAVQVAGRLKRLTTVLPATGAYRPRPRRDSAMSTASPGFGRPPRWSLPGGGDHPKRKGRDRSGQGVDTPQEIAALCSYLTCPLSWAPQPMAGSPKGSTPI